MVKNICVFCGSNRKFRDDLAQEAKDLAIAFKQNNFSMVFGGGAVGLMGALADEMLSQDVYVCGIIPGFLSEKEIGHKQIDELIVVDTMHTRKQLMLDRSDAFLVLPGGFGTLDELFEMLTWSQLNIHQKPIAVWNINGFFDHILAHVNMLVSHQFLKQEDADRLIVHNDMNALLQALSTASVMPSTKVDDARRMG